MHKNSFRLLGLIIALSGFAISSYAADQAFPAVGELKQYAPEFALLIKPNTKIEKIAEGFEWAEGPVWVPEGKYLLADDVPQNTMHRWTAHDGLTVFLKPSGLEGSDSVGFSETGANGLFLESAHTLLAADSGNRRITRIDLTTKHKAIVVDTYQGKKFNSPNDMIKSRSGNIYFTDPPYGLKGGNDSPLKELKFNGVFRVDSKGVVSVIDDSLTFPNGIALSPDELTLYVSVSDPTNPIWMAYSLDASGAVIAKRDFANAKDLVAEKLPGLPDGMKVAKDGHLFASAPGGILVMSATGKRLGLITTGAPIANCAFGDDGKTLYMTSQHSLARVRLLIKAQ